MPTEFPAVIAFEGRCYRLDRIASIKESDPRVVREKKPYTPPEQSRRKPQG